MNKTGKIGVTTDNIFPVIKKFLYSDHEIFLRELVSNAVDASEKLRTLSTRGQTKGEIGELTVRVDIDEQAGTLTVSDNGVGMTAEELDRYINEIAFSGAEEFLEKYKDDKTSIIGHFGLGFYSSFMVAERVEIFTKSYAEGSQAVHWSCTGSPDYVMEPCDKTERGTQIVLHVDADNKEFLGRERIEGLLKKYCRFLTTPIVFGKEQVWKDGKYTDGEKDNQINNTQPAWTRKPTELTDEDYRTFYRELYPMADDPLFWIHLNVDYPFNLTGILYFPQVAGKFDLERNKVQLYCNRVFVTNEVEGIVPDYLTLLHGILDSPDIPLNVSRSYLQNDSSVRKISSHITKKVADRLEEIFKTDRKIFEEKWADLKVFIAYGMLTDDKFYDRASKFFLLTDTDGKMFTIDEYKSLIENEQTDKDKRLVYLYATEKQTQWTHISRAAGVGYNVLLMDGQLDLHLMSRLEQKTENTAFVRVDSDTVEKLIPKDNIASVALSEEDKGLLSGIFDARLPKEEKRVYRSRLEAQGKTADAVTIVQDEYMRRMQEMAKLQPGMAFYGQLPETYTFVLNTENTLIERLLSAAKSALDSDLAPLRAALKVNREAAEKLRDEQSGKKTEELTDDDRKNLEDARAKESAAREALDKTYSAYAAENDTIGQLIDLALLSGGLLSGESLAAFIRRSEQLL